MFSFLTRSKMTCKGLAEAMATKFVSMWMQEYDEELLARGHNSWIQRARVSKSDAKAKEEWLLFCLAGYIQGCRSSMGDSDLHSTFAREFFEACGREVEVQRIFPTTANEFVASAALRSTEYCSLLSESDPGRSIRLVGEKFLENVGCSPKDVVQSLIALDFLATATTTKELFDKLKRTIRLVPA
jgi:hypothetical protein